MNEWENTYTHHIWYDWLFWRGIIVQGMIFVHIINITSMSQKMERESWGRNNFTNNVQILVLTLTDNHRVSYGYFKTLTKFHIYSKGSSECRAGIEIQRKIQAYWTQVLSLDNGPENEDRSISADAGPLSCLMSTIPERMPGRTIVCASDWGQVARALRRD